MFGKQNKSFLSRLDWVIWKPFACFISLQSELSSLYTPKECSSFPLFNNYWLIDTMEAKKRQDENAINRHEADWLIQHAYNGGIAH